MKLLFDQNVSPKLVQKLADLFPGSVHVQSAGLASSNDDEIWQFALREGLAIVSKDVDYNTLSILRGHPPKVIWLQLGNCTNRHIEQRFRDDYHDLMAFEQDTGLGTYVMS